MPLFKKKYPSMESPWLYKECMWRKGVHNSIYVGAYLGQLQGGKTPFKA